MKRGWDEGAWQLPSYKQNVQIWIRKNVVDILRSRVNVPSTDFTCDMLAASNENKEKTHNTDRAVDHDTRCFVFTWAMVSCLGLKFHIWLLSCWLASFDIWSAKGFLLHMYMQKEISFFSPTVTVLNIYNHPRFRTKTAVCPQHYSLDERYSIT